MTAAATVLLLLLAAGGCGRAPRTLTPSQPSPRQEVIRQVQETERSLGFEATGSFSRHAPDQEAFYRCYYTDKMRLPDSYSGLKVKDGNEEGCNINEEKYDVFFYRIEAVASRKTPATASLDKASLERLAVVVSHEDIHQQEPIRRLPAAVEEPATTLISFLTAAEYARRFHGEDSLVYRNLSGEAATFLAKAAVVNDFHRKLSELYDHVAAGRVTAADAAWKKQKHFERLSQTCQEILPDPTSFNKCPAVVNNAGLAFDHTYTKHYALLYQLAAEHGHDVKRVVESLQRLPKKDSEGELVTHLEKLLEKPAPSQVE